MSAHDQNRDSLENESDFGREGRSSIPSSVLLRHIARNVQPVRAHGSPDEDAAARHKRRTKVESDARTFKCRHCNKTYLSYPALYTHMKTKHASPHDALPPGSGRSRGRPKKVFGAAQ